MTACRRDGMDSPFGEWMRKHPDLDSGKRELSIIDADWWVHKFRSHKDKIGERKIDHIMCVELKTYSAQLTFPQRDTLMCVNGYHAKFAQTRDGRTKTAQLWVNKELRRVRFYGYFLLQLSGSSPSNSDVIKWHGRTIDEAMLLEILSFDRHPVTLQRRSDRRHHVHFDPQGYLDI